MSTGESIKLVMLAFALGLGVPLALQAFVTLRAVHKVVTSTQARLDRALEGLEGLEGLVARAPGATAASPPATQALSVLGAALVPAALTAFKVWKEASAGAGAAAVGGAADAAEGTADVPPAPSRSSSLATSDKENGHART
jgi:hypothetical protein